MAMSSRMVKAASVLPLRRPTLSAPPPTLLLIPPTKLGIRCSANRENSRARNINVVTKVFSDEPKGILCYLDKSGELTCEGFDDEGLHFHSYHNELGSSVCKRSPCRVEGYQQLATAYIMAEETPNLYASGFAEERIYVGKDES